MSAIYSGVLEHARLAALDYHWMHTGQFRVTQMNLSDQCDQPLGNLSLIRDQKRKEQGREVAESLDRIEEKLGLPFDCCHLLCPTSAVGKSRTVAASQKTRSQVQEARRNQVSKIGKKQRGDNLKHAQQGTKVDEVPKTAGPTGEDWDTTAENLGTTGENLGPVGVDRVDLVLFGTPECRVDEERFRSVEGLYTPSEACL
ncbi:hypothetical protein FB45DRAFT_1000276 [Roridomyces roridus]|uniref:Uncharacterized protein n=1 Tax=Roridomyces roridus TaxID=1738132 RepID=A0AAD7FVR1_9AGAR|nr:hypothetical protein FB45DRAFT_1000276 [Roridomyces roridus]